MGNRWDKESLAQRRLGRKDGLVGKQCSSADSAYTSGWREGRKKYQEQEAMKFLDSLPDFEALEQDYDVAWIDPIALATWAREVIDIGVTRAATGKVIVDTRDGELVEGFARVLEKHLGAYCLPLHSFARDLTDEEGKLHGVHAAKRNLRNREDRELYVRKARALLTELSGEKVDSD